MSGKQPTKKGKEVVQDRYEEEFTEDEIRDEHAQPDPETEEEPTFTKRIPWKDLADEDLPWGVSRHADGHFVVTNDFIYPFDRIVNILSEDYPNRINDFCKEVLASSDTISCESFHKRILDLEWIKGINEFYQEKAASEANLGIVPDGQNTDALAHVPRGSISRSRRPSVSTVGTNASRSRRAQDDQWKCVSLKEILPRPSPFVKFSG